MTGQHPLPQILGLTASPGTGGGRILEKAVEHVLQVRVYAFGFGFCYLFVANKSRSVGSPTVLSSYLSLLQICANLDSAIVSTKNYAPELKKMVPRPIKRFDIVEKRPVVSKYFLIYISRSKPLFVEFRISKPISIYSADNDSLFFCRIHLVSI